MKRLGLLVIGDEILAGHTQDTNSHWVAGKCNTMGVALRRVEVCTDDLDDIVASVRRFLEELPVDYVVTSGGLGPTHDDRTMEGIAEATGRPLELTDANREWMEERVRIGHRMGYFEAAEVNEGHLKMARLPQGAQPMPNHIGTCLGAILEHEGRYLFTLPGVPSEFVRMFEESVEPVLEDGEPQHVEEIILYSEESRFYPMLRDLDASYDDVAIGSYPGRGFILVRATGPVEEAKEAIGKVRDEAAAYLEPDD